MQIAELKSVACIMGVEVDDLNDLRVLARIMKSTGAREDHPPTNDAS